VRKIILYIAMTLDGFIADENDGFSFLNEYDNLESIQNSYSLFINRIDTLIMGRVTYDVLKDINEWPYKDYQSYVMTKQADQYSDSRVLFRNNLESLLKDLQQVEGKDIWLVGGGVLIETFLKHNLIDEYQIAIIPKFIGKGKKLFTLSEIEAKLKLEKVEKMDEIVMLTYLKK
jgi:dihydrofolate reductase